MVYDVLYVMICVLRGVCGVMLCVVLCVVCVVVYDA